MKRFLLQTILSLCVSISFAQTQQGIVKTNGRPNKPGTPLGNVAVKASGRSVSLSAADGAFGIAMNGMKGGEAFFLTSVTRHGYELADRNSVGRKYSFSPSVPMVLTMVSKSELEAEKQRIRNNAIVATQKKYEQQVEELEKKLEAQIITADAFGEKLQELQAMMDKYNELVENLADKYARTDYDQIDEVDKEINIAIEEGLFDKADSLIHTKGDIDERHKKALEWSLSSKKQKGVLDEQMAQWETSEASRLKELENLAEDYYHSFTIDLSRMNYEKALSWLVKRSELDPERSDWLIDIASYYKNFLAKYDLAMEYFDRAYKIAKKTKQILQQIMVKSGQGGVYMYRYEIEKARKCYEDILRYAKNGNVEDSEVFISAYGNLGLLELNVREYDKALEYYQMALSFVNDSTIEETADLYLNISTIYYNMNQFEVGQKYLDNAIDVATKTNNKQTLATCFINKGVFSNELGDDRRALEYFEQALKFLREILPEAHPEIAKILNNMSAIYQSLSRMQESLNYTIDALEIYQSVYGENHPEVALCYNNIAKIFLDVGHYDKASTYAGKSWEIRRKFFPENSVEYAEYCNIMGMVHENHYEDSLSVESYFKAMRIYEALGLESTPKYAYVCGNISNVLNIIGRKDEAFFYAKKSLEMISSVKGEENISYIGALNNLASIYEKAGRVDTALILFEKAEMLIMRTYGKWHDQLAINYNNRGNLLIGLQEYEKARRFIEMSTEICDSIYKTPSELKMINMANMASTYYRDGKLGESIPWFEKAGWLRTNLFKQENADKYKYHMYIYNNYFDLAKSGDVDDLNRFKECQDTLWVNLRIVPNGTAEQKYGLSGDYLMLFYGNWEQGGEMNFIDEITRMRPIVPKEMVIYRDDKFERMLFKEESIGVQFYIKSLERSEAMKIKAAYVKWKRENTK